MITALTVLLSLQIMDLESRLAQALEENSHMAHLPNGAGGGSGGGRKRDVDWIPTSSSAKHTLTGHRDSVNTVAFHPIYSVLATASDDSSVKIWDWDSGEVERTLKAHTKRVSDCQFNSTGTVLVTCSYDLFIKLWNVDNDYQNSATLRGHEHSISSARFLNGDDRVISSSRDHTLRIWEVQTTHCVKVITPHDEWIRCAVPSADGRYAITSSADHTSKIVDLASGDVRAEFRGHDNVVEAAQFCPPHSAPAIRELLALKGLGSSPAPPGTSIVFAVTASRDKTVRIWDAIRGQCLYTLVGHDDWVRSIVFHPNGQYLLTSSDDHSFRIWDLKTGRCARKIEAHERFVTCMSWGRQVVNTGKEGATETSKAGGEEEGPPLVNVIATCSSDQTVKVWLPQR